jgi:1-acyl-sn-glycerol-3-phosphate acyltransferase
MGIVDVLCLLGAWAARYDGARRGVGMMHKMFITAPIVGAIARGFGAVPADPAAAKLAFARGYDVASFPGGDIDSCRPFNEARRVFFGPRRGYIRLALAERVPIVPLATLGSHHTYTLLPGGAAIARVTRMKRWARCERFPLVLGTVIAVAVLALTIAGLAPWWALALAMLAMVVPNPVRVTTLVLPPIDVAARTAHIADPDARIEAAHELVFGALEHAVATMEHGEQPVTSKA